MARNKEERADYMKAYYEANKEKIAAYKKAYGKAYYEANKEKMAAYIDANKERLAAYGKAYYQDNKEKMAAYNKAYRDANKKNIAAYHYTYEIERKKTDPLFKLTRDIRNLIRSSFKNQGYSKNTKTANILGCSFEELQSHLGEKTDNDHIDHIIPLAWGNTEEEIYTLNHYSNLQILTAAENIAKGNRFTRLDNVKKVLSLHPYPERIQEILDRNQDKIVA